MVGEESRRTTQAIVNVCGFSGSEVGSKDAIKEYVSE